MKTVTFGTPFSIDLDGEASTLIDEAIEAFGNELRMPDHLWEGSVRFSDADQSVTGVLTIKAVPLTLRDFADQRCRFLNICQDPSIVRLTYHTIIANGVVCDVTPDYSALVISLNMDDEPQIDAWSLSLTIASNDPKNQWSATATSYPVGQLGMFRPFTQNDVEQPIIGSLFGNSLTLLETLEIVTFTLDFAETTE